jgi:hypothetical protein
MPAYRRTSELQARFGSHAAIYKLRWKNSRNFVAAVDEWKVFREREKALAAARKTPAQQHRSRVKLQWKIASPDQIQVAAARRKTKDAA